MSAAIEIKNETEGAILPPARIGIIGGGQLGRMFAFEAKRMGYTIVVLDPIPDCPTAQVCDIQITASHYDATAIRKLAEITDIVTYEFEHLDAGILCRLSEEGFRIRPSGYTLKSIQDKYLQKSLFKNNRLPVPEFFQANDLDEVLAAANTLGWPVMLKSRTGGYDGKGNVLIGCEKQLCDAWDLLSNAKGGLMLEQYIAYEREISIIVARGTDKKTVFYPIAENNHINNILHMTRVYDSLPESVVLKMRAIAQKTMDLLDDVGIFCIEMFLTSAGDVYINELAPRPHNSGHFTIEGCITSQFEQHLRAITGLPLGSTKLIKPAVMINILGLKPMHDGFKIEGLDEILLEEEVYFHFYGKHFIDTNKKIGHITALGNSIHEAQNKALNAFSNIKINPCVDKWARCSK